jgi:hypothetical protein
MWISHPSCNRSWSVLITFKTSESSKEVHPGSTEAVAKLLFVAIANMKHCTLSFSRSFPHHGQFFRPLNLIIVSVPIVRHRDATPQSFSATVLTTLRPHGLTLLSSVLSTPDTRLVKWPLQPHSSHKKGSPFSRTAYAKAPCPSELGIPTTLVLSQLDFGHLATRASLPSVRSSPNK